MKIIFFATLLEASATIRRLNAVPQQEVNRYLFKDGEIIITGIGIEAAHRAAMRAPSTDCSWVNLGIGGCVQNCFPIRTVVCIGRVSLLQWVAERGVFCPQPLSTILIDPSHPASLFSAPSPVYSTPEVPEGRALVDMEGYAFAKVAHEKKVPISIIKVVSDFCTKNSHREIMGTIDALSERLAEVCFSTQSLASIPRPAGL